MMKCKVLILSGVLLFLSNFLIPGDRDFIKLEKIGVTKPLEKQVFPDLNSITIDQKGNIFAFAGKLNGNDCFIVKYDNDLNFVTTFGRSGKGPGEFTTQYTTAKERISIARNGDVCVVDYNPLKLVFFDNNGIFKDEIHLQRKYSDFIGFTGKIKIVGNNVFIGRKHLKDKNPVGIIFTLTPPEIKTRYPFNEEKISVKEGSTMIMGITDFCYGDNHFIDTDSERIVFGNSQIYKFHVYDKTGRLIIEVEKKGKRLGVFTDKELNVLNVPFEKAKESLPKLYKKGMNELKNRKNVIADIKISGERVFVFPVSEDISVPDKQPVEIYNLKGEIIKKGYLRGLPESIRGDCIFFKERDDEDNPIILKFKMRD